MRHGGCLRFSQCLGDQPRARCVFGRLLVVHSVVVLPVARAPAPGVVAVAVGAGMFSCRCVVGCCGVAPLGCSTWCRLYGHVRTEGSELPRLLGPRGAPVPHCCDNIRQQSTTSSYCVHVCCSLGVMQQQQPNSPMGPQVLCECEDVPCAYPRQAALTAPLWGWLLARHVRWVGAQSPGMCASRLMLWGRSILVLAGYGRMLRGGSAQRWHVRLRL